MTQRRCCVTVKDAMGKWMNMQFNMTLLSDELRFFGA